MAAEEADSGERPAAGARSAGTDRDDCVPVATRRRVARRGAERAPGARLRQVFRSAVRGRPEAGSASRIEYARWAAGPARSPRRETALAAGSASAGDGRGRHSERQALRPLHPIRAARRRPDHAACGLRVVPTRLRQECASDRRAGRVSAFQLGQPDQSRPHARRARPRARME